MTENDVKKYLLMSYDQDLVYTLHLYLSNDYYYYSSHLMPCVGFARRKIAKGIFNPYLFIQAVKLGIDGMLRDSSFRKVYFDLPSKIGLPERYQVAKHLANYILVDFLDMKEIK